MRLYLVLGLLLVAAVVLAHDLGLTAIQVSRGDRSTHIRLRTPLSRLANTDVGPRPNPADFDLAVRSRLGISQALHADLKLDSAADLLEWNADMPSARFSLTKAFYPEDETARTVVTEGDEIEQVIGGTSQSSSPVAAVPYGTLHILFGPDHVAFVCALVLLGGTFKSTLKVLTAFTLAHGLTMALSATGLVQISPRIIEPLIALSIVALALELLRKKDAPSRLGWCLAFGFGLVHGLGFAGCMSWAGLNGTALLSQLALFSLGVEIGQVIIVLAFALILGAVGRIGEDWSRRFAWAATTLVGMAGSYWFVERLI